MTIPSGHKIRLHNVLYVPTLDVSLFSTKQHMKFEGCYEHSQNNACTIAFPTTTINAEVKNEIEFTVRKPDSDHSIQPSFDEATAKLYSSKTTTINFQRPTHASTLQVHITSTLKGKGKTFIPTQATPEAIGYDLKSPKATSIPPQGRKAVPLGIAIATPPGLCGRITPRSGLALHHNINVAGGG